MEKSIILPWSKDNIEKVPSGCGVLMLRTTPVNGDVVLIKVSSNLKADFGTIFETENRSDVKYFDWYETTDLPKAEEAKLELVKKYHLEGLF
jgi:hypothetical protein